MYSPIAKSPQRTLGALLAGSLLFAGAACSRSHTVSAAGGKVGYRKKGKDAGTYPMDVPIYSPSKVMMSQSASGKNAHNLVLESAGATMTTAQLTILTATQERRQVMLQITGSGAKHNLMQVVSDKQ